MPDGLPTYLALDWNGTVVPFFAEAPYPGAVEVLAELRSAGVKLYIVSHATQAMIAADVRRVGLEVDRVIGCYDKAPEFQLLVAQYGLGLAIGDSDLVADRVVRAIGGNDVKLAAEPPGCGGLVHRANDHLPPRGGPAVVHPIAGTRLLQRRHRIEDARFPVEESDL